jgi:hypothetical protein
MAGHPVNLAPADVGGARFARTSGPGRLRGVAKTVALRGADRIGDFSGERVRP